MLKKRLTTAAVLIPLVIIFIFVLSPLAFSIVAALLTLVAAWEWTHLMGLKTTASRVRYLFTLALILTVLWVLFAGNVISARWLLELSAIWWLLAFYFVLRYPKQSTVWARNVLSLGFMGFLVLIPLWIGLNSIHAQWQGNGFLCFILALTWASDSGAYFVGRRWGKTKLAPQVSPGKTWQGLYGALAAGLIVAIPGGYFLSSSPTQWLLLISYAVLVVLFSVLGDLLESMLKREHGVKDSGCILPGHGGVLDRIDSLTAAVPIFALMLIYMGVSG